MDFSTRKLRTIKSIIGKILSKKEKQNRQRKKQISSRSSQKCRGPNEGYSQRGSEGQGPGAKRWPFTAWVRGLGSKRGLFTEAVGAKRGLFTLGVRVQTRAVHGVQQPGRIWGSIAHIFLSC